MELLSLWNEKHAAGKVRFDSDLLIIHSASKNGNYNWGTVFYSQARENYKSRVKTGKATFDLELMRELELGEFGNLIIAANPNSLFPGHLVIYPKIKSAELNFQDIYDVTRLAQTHTEQTFIHNREGSAASILDWAHYQSYPIVFPLETEEFILLGEFESVKVGRVAGNFPAYALVAEFSEAKTVAAWLLKILELLSGKENPHHKKIPCGFIWRRNRVWIVPRALNQSSFAATYFGGLEIGGIFCLPNADDFRRYLPDSLRREIAAATLACEPETQKWFEESALKLLCEIV